MMLIRYLSQIGGYFLMLKEIFNKQTKWPVMKNLIFKEKNTFQKLLQSSINKICQTKFFHGTPLLGDHFEHATELH